MGTPSLGTSICPGHSPKSKKKKKSHRINKIVILDLTLCLPTLSCGIFSKKKPIVVFQPKSANQGVGAHCG